MIVVHEKRNVRFFLNFPVFCLPVIFSIGMVWVAGLVESFSIKPSFDRAFPYCLSLPKAVDFVGLVVLFRSVIFSVFVNKGSTFYKLSVGRFWAHCPFAEHTAYMAFSGPTLYAGNIA
jgi:formate hydrogenlyase subunit 4